MRVKLIVAGLAVALFGSLAFADLTPWKDYEVSEHVWAVTTVKVNSNMDDAYLEGLRDTWVAGNEVSKKLGQIEDWKIMRSDLPNSGDFNLLLMTKFKNTGAFGPSKKNYDDFVDAWSQKKVDETTEFAQKNYPAMRTITGGYLMRDIKLK